MKQVIILDDLEGKDLHMEINKAIFDIENSPRPQKVNDIKFLESFDELLVMISHRN
jgi:hypothetical protein